ncbi:MAG: AsmA-like C-terminal region-containing protein [Verrucomicrobiota bacterium]
MGKFFKNIGLLLLSTAIVLTALGILLQNYMQSREFIEKISQSFSDSFGGTVSVQSTDINLLRGFSLDQVLVLSSDDPPQEFLAVEHSVLTYNPFALFLKKLELSTIQLEGAELSFTQAPSGNWWLPRPTADTTPVLDTGLLAFEMILKDISLNQGVVTVIRKDGALVLDAHGINIEGSLKAREVGIESSGQLAIANTRLGKYFAIRDMTSPVTYENEVLTIPSLSGKAYDGSATGSIEIDLRIGGPEFTITLNLEQLDIAQLITDFQAKSQWLDGKLTTSCKVSGYFEDPELLQGTGTLQITEGTLSGFTFIKELAQLFPNQSFPETNFDSITGNYKIAEKKLTIYDLEAISQDVQLTGTGTISSSRELNLDMRLSLSPDFTALLASETAAKFNQRDDEFSTITFTVTGTLDEPESNLIDKLNQNAELKQTAPPEQPVENSDETPPPAPAETSTS